MKLDSLELYKKLKEKGVSYLYHANTLKTSLGFIENGGLLSRGEMERRHILQTDQDSDNVDKMYNVWNDIFLDTIDLHGYYPRQNFYGPVLFELKLNLLLDEELNNVWITKNNPIHWTDSNTEQDRYFNTVDNYIRNINCNRQQKMITIRNVDKVISFEKYLNCIKLDDPKRKIAGTHISAYKYAYDKLYNSNQKVKLNVNIIEHECSNCFCINNYRRFNESEFLKLF